MTKKLIKITTFIFLSLILVVMSYQVVTNANPNPQFKVGDVVDSFNGVPVYYNGGINHVLERNTSKDGYNIGLKYQCVEFVKRYYLEHYKHRMPDTYGHARDFFDPTVKQGKISPRRALKQYRNGKDTPPKVGDILVYKPTLTNPYGHVAIVSKVDLTRKKVEIIQQNPGPFSPSRETYSLENHQGWHIRHKSALGWLRMIE